MSAPDNAQRPVRVGTRGSRLALAQAKEVCARLAAAHQALAAPGALETVIIKTEGDRILDRPLADIGGKGLFTKEIEEALLSGRIDMAVHSMKDMETWLPDGLTIAAILPREDPRDVLLSPKATSIADLPPGAVVGTASLRRQAQLLHARPDIKVVPFRGNVQTRMKKLEAGAVDATILALAGLRRLGLDGHEKAAIAVSDMLPAVAQGAICIECRAGDGATRALLAPLDDSETADCVRAERALLAALDGSCRTPIAGLATRNGGGLSLDALIATPDGATVYRAGREGAAADAADMGRDLGEELRARAGPGFFAAGS